MLSRVKSCKKFTCWIYALSERLLVYEMPLVTEALEFAAIREGWQCATAVVCVVWGYYRSRWQTLQSALPLLGNFPEIWEFGNELGFREYSKQSWEFWYIQEISWNTSKLTTTNVGCVHSAITAFTYLSRSFLKHCSSHSSAVKTQWYWQGDPACGNVIFHFLSAWEF